MSTTPYQHMAKEFMDLWQKQVASVVSDKDFIQAMLGMVQSMKMPNAPSPQPADTANASGSDTGIHAQMAYRLAMCERRLAALEKAPGKKTSSQKTARKPARRGKTPK
jgi:hypothetical protein